MNKVTIFWRTVGSLPFAFIYLPLCINVHYPASSVVTRLERRLGFVPGHRPSPLTTLSAPLPAGGGEAASAPVGRGGQGVQVCRGRLGTETRLDHGSLFV